MNTPVAMINFNDRDFPALPRAEAESSRSSGTMATKEGRHVATGAVATINDLPEELHLCILHYLPGIDQEDFQLASLISLSKTNRHFRRLTIAKIYASYNSHFCEPYLFLRTLTNNTDLGSLVKHAEFTYGTWAHLERQRYTAHAQDKKVIKEGLKALGISDWKNLATQCNTDHVEIDTLHTVILMQTPNISSLIVRDGQLQTMHGTSSPKWIDLIRKTNLGTPDIGRLHRFRHLHTLRVEIQYMNLTQLAPIFRIASLQKLYLANLIEDYDGKNRADQLFRYIIPQRCNNLEELHLERSRLEIDILQVVLASARSLKVFVYDILIDEIQWDFERKGSGTTNVVTALKCQSTSLERFSLPFYGYLNDYIGRKTSCFEELKDFSAMKHLTCPIASIVDVDSYQEMALFEKLPPSLESFHANIHMTPLDSDAKNIALALEQLAADSAKHMPLLNVVHIESRLGTSYDWSRAVEAFSRTSIDFAVKQDYQDESPLYSPNSDIHRPPYETESESSGEVSLYSH
jgi:hypothetical protein